MSANQQDSRVEVSDQQSDSDSDNMANMEERILLSKKHTELIEQLRQNHIQIAMLSVQNATYRKRPYKIQRAQYWPYYRHDTTGWFYCYRSSIVLSYSLLMIKYVFISNINFYCIY